MMQDISITGVDDGMTESDPAPSKMKRIFFKLSATPPSEWAQLFTEERRFPRHSMWRRAHVYGSHIQVHCPLDEAQKHLDEFKEDVKNVNAKYRAWLAQEKQRQSVEAEADAENKQEISDALGKLKF
jgi:hypothetical protein